MAFQRIEFSFHQDGGAMAHAFFYEVIRMAKGFPKVTVKKVKVKKIVVCDSCKIDYEDMSLDEKSVPTLADWRSGDTQLELTIQPIKAKGYATFEGVVVFPNVMITKVVVAEKSVIEVSNMHIMPDQAQVLALFRQEDVQVNLVFKQNQGELI